MAIVRMKRLRMMALASERERILRLLAEAGVIEISEVEAVDDGMSRDIETDVSDLRQSLDVIMSAQSVAKKYGKFKKGLFAARPEISVKKIFSPELIVSALDEAEKINAYDKALSELQGEKARLSAKKEIFVPWKELGTELDCPCGKFFETTLMQAPSAVDMKELEDAVANASDCTQIFEISSDRDLHYLFVISHIADAEKARGALKSLGASVVKFRGVKMSARSKINEIEKRIEEIEQKITAKKESINISAEQYDLLLIAQDALETRLSCESAAEMGAETEHVFYIEGWCPARDEKVLSEVFEKNGCAYEFSDPAEGEDVPTLTYNSKIIAPFETVTNMYSAPAYTGIDPNPTMAPFFALFFGIMLSDAGYGLLLILAGVFALWKLKLKGTFRNFMKLSIICGISTVIWGLAFGGIFGNSIPAAYEMFTGNVFPYEAIGLDPQNGLALWFDPTNNPMLMLIFSMALGGVQIVAGMAVKAYMMIRDGHVWDAIFDIGFWWVLFAGALICLINTTVGLYVLGAGALGLILTQGRAKKNIIMKFFSGVLSLYDITGYFSDILSYSRLLALSLATAVVSQVINTMGVLTGPIGFFFVLLIGHVFNIAINLVGSFVHSARLQYVEYFGKFYESGGRQFAPLTIKSKNTDIIKEEN